MIHMRVAIDIAATPAEVWADLRHIDRHVEWMRDAVGIRFVSDQHQQVGTIFDCKTRVGPIRLTDRMEITSWVDNQEMGVRHVGLVTGEGCFTLNETSGGRTEFSWTEALSFPWWLGGRLGELAGGPILKRIWRRNLQALAQRFTAG